MKFLLNIFRKKPVDEKLHQNVSYLIAAYRDGTPEERVMIEELFLKQGKKRGDDWGEEMVQRLRNLPGV